MSPHDIAPCCAALSVEILRSLRRDSLEADREARAIARYSHCPHCGKQIRAKGTEDRRLERRAMAAAARRRRLGIDPNRFR